MKDSHQEKKKVTKAGKEKRFKFAAQQLDQEKKRHLELAKQELSAYRRGIRSFAFAASIKKNLALAGADPETIGITSEELDGLELELIDQAIQEMEYLRLHPDSTRLIILAKDMRQAGYSPELLGTTQIEMRELEERAKRDEAARENPFPRGIRIS
ncbi:hypothetical protein HZC53_05045 [Candidatus Uhrbacteria bacterium]|nr:hypothetical protein [Candidatus Uhrbacteria bacterium]